MYASCYYLCYILPMVALHEQCADCVDALRCMWRVRYIGGGGEQGEEEAYVRSWLLFCSLFDDRHAALPLFAITALLDSLLTHVVSLFLENLVPRGAGST